MIMFISKFNRSKAEATQLRLCQPLPVMQEERINSQEMIKQNNLCRLKYTRIKF